jgi:hypothetical protein
MFLPAYIIIPYRYVSFLQFFFGVLVSIHLFCLLDSGKLYILWSMLRDTYNVIKTNQMHIFHNNLFHLNYPLYVSNNSLFIIRRSSVHAAYSILPFIIRIVSATRFLLRCMVRYCKLLVQNSS